MCERGYLRGLGSKPRAPTVEEATLPDKENANHRSYRKEDIEGVSGCEVSDMRSKCRHGR
jgi:hypothetical protein